MLGETCVGKTSLIQRYNSDTFSLQHITTLGIDFVTKEVTRDDKELITARIWDTAGQEKFRTVTKSFYKQADGILLVFDLTDQESFDKLHLWVNNIREVAGQEVIKFLVGNKLDLTESREIETENAMKIAAEYNMKYYETSAKQKTGVNEVFSDIINEICDRKKYTKNCILEKIDPTKKSCC